MIENTETGCKVGGDEEKLLNWTKLPDASILAMIFNCFSFVGIKIIVFQYPFHNLCKLRKLRLLVILSKRIQHTFSKQCYLFSNEFLYSIPSKKILLDLIIPLQPILLPGKVMSVLCAHQLVLETKHISFCNSSYSSD